MLIVAYGLALLTVAAAAYAFVKPHTKEKFFFCGVAALHVIAVLFAAPVSPVSLEENIQQAKRQRAATVPGEHFPNFLAQMIAEAHEGHRADATAQSEVAVEDPIATVLQETYPQGEGAKPLYFREIVVRPLGRVVLEPPSTPGVDVVTNWTPMGPELPRLTHRQPLGILDPLPGQTLPEE